MRGARYLWRQKGAERTERNESKTAGATSSAGSTSGSPGAGARRGGGAVAAPGNKNGNGRAVDGRDGLELAVKTAQELRREAMQRKQPSVLALDKVGAGSRGSRPSAIAGKSVCFSHREHGSSPPKAGGNGCAAAGEIARGATVRRQLDRTNVVARAERQKKLASSPPGGSPPKSLYRQHSMNDDMMDGQSSARAERNSAHAEAQSSGAVVERPGRMMMQTRKDARQEQRKCLEAMRKRRNSDEEAEGGGSGASTESSGTSASFASSSTADGGHAPGRAPLQKTRTPPRVRLQPMVESEEDATATASLEA